MKLKNKNDLTVDILRSLLRYNRKTGVFTWRFRSIENSTSASERKRWNARYAGKEAGCAITPSRCNGQYRSITLLGHTYYAHRLAWLYVTGEWPINQIDHRDSDGLNNRWKNLRLATTSQNLANRDVQKNNSLGIKGVRRTSAGRYRSRIQVRGKCIALGTYATKEEAAAAHKEAAKKHYGNYSWR